MNEIDGKQLLHSAGLDAVRGAWGLGAIAEAVGAVGWCGDLRGPVVFGGTMFIAVCRRCEPLGAPGSPWLAGCLFPAADPRTAMREASLLAGYSRRAILVRNPADPLDIQLQTALLDQGAVIECDGKLTVLSTPGNVVPSPLQEPRGWQNDGRWLAFHRAVMAARLLTHIH